jgi:hypothetical protein
MINYARTLLLNVRGSTSSRENTGEEYIPAEYVPVSLPTYLQTVRRILFGTSPDRYFLNFRARELMSYLHTTELADYVYKLDARVTYWPEQTLSFYDTEKRVMATQSSGLPTRAPSFQGNLFADNANGRAVREFTVRATSESGGWVSIVSANDAPGAVVTAPLTFTSGLSNAVTLGNTGLSFKIQQPPSATNWQIYTRVQPTAALTTLLPLLELAGEPTYIDLFGVDNTTEPYVTFKQLWFDSNNPIYRLGGLTLAVIYRTNQVRLSADGYIA